MNEHEDGRIILNYNQLNSPKTHPIVRECRSLTVNRNGELIARSFPRFFNWGELVQEFRWDSPITAFDKIDGSLIKIFWRDGWKIQTRNSFATDYVNGSNHTWGDLVNSCLTQFYKTSNLEHYTFVCELTSPYNAVVQQHAQTNLWLLAAFYKEDELADYIVDELAIQTGLKRPAQHTFYDLIEVQKYVAGETNKYNAFEGVVLKDIEGTRLKIKSEKYIALHRLFNNGNLLSDKNIIPLIIDGEVDEVAAYFPLIRERADELKSRIDALMNEVNNYWYCFGDYTSKKEFALAVNKCRWKPLLFMAYSRGGNPVDYLTADFVIRWMSDYSPT